MPKAAPYLLAWSVAQQCYTLTRRANNEMLDIMPESPAWFAWLDEAPSFTFQGKAGAYTARKESIGRCTQSISLLATEDICSEMSLLRRIIPTSLSKSGFWLDDQERLPPGSRRSCQKHEETSISLGAHRLFALSTKDDELLAYERIFGDKFGFPLGQIRQCPEQQ